jgi:hypothetical protein
MAAKVHRDAVTDIIVDDKQNPPHLNPRFVFMNTSTKLLPFFFFFLILLYLFVCVFFFFLSSFGFFLSFLLIVQEEALEQGG